MKTFEDSRSWILARELNKKLYSEFSTAKERDFKSQILRASVSISNNIAEGFERNSQKELKYFLYIAKGSCGEVRSMLYLALDIGYISEDTFKELYNDAYEISQLLAGFIRSIKS